MLAWIIIFVCLCVHTDSFGVVLSEIPSYLFFFCCCFIYLLFQTGSHYASLELDV